MKKGFLNFNAQFFSSKEVSGVGTVGTMRLLRGRTTKTLNYIGRLFAYTPSRSYGCFFLSFGLLSLFLHLGEYYFMADPTVPFSSLLLSAALAICGVPLLLSVKPMCTVLQDFPVTDVILFDFLGMKRMHRNTTHATVPPLVALFVGFVPATVGYFLSVEWVTLILVFIVVGAVALTSPEFSMILTIVLLPYVRLLTSEPEILLCVMSLVTFISYAMKVVIGKRVLNIDVYSVLAIIMAIFLLLSGFFGIGETSLKKSLVAISLLAAYFPISNIVVNRRLADSVVNAVIVSSIPISVVAFIEFIVENPHTPYKTVINSTAGTTAFFANSASLSAFLLVSVILTLCFVIDKKNKFLKALYFAILTLEVVALSITLQPGIWVAALFAAVSYSVIRIRKIPIDTVLLLIVCAHLFFLLPNPLVDSLYELLEITPLFSERLSGFSDAFSILSENGWFGIGEYGDGVYNGYLAMGVAFGIPTVIFSVFVIIARLRHLSYYRLYVRNSLVETVGDMSSIAIIAFLVYSAYENLFSDVSVMYLFIVIFALSGAILRTAKAENDDLLGYYGDSSSRESGALDVSVNT